MDGIKNNFTIISYGVLILIIVVASFLYFKQQQQISLLEEEISKIKVEQVVREEKELIQTTEDISYQTQTPTSEERPDLFGEEQISDTTDRTTLIKKAKEEHFLEIISPRDGDQLCLGENTEIAWRGSIDIGSVDVKIRKGSQGVARSIGSYPVSFNEFGLDNGEGVVIWKVGTVGGGEYIYLNEGFSYQLIMQGIYPIKPEDRLYGTATDFHQAGGFSIINCSG